MRLRASRLPRSGSAAATTGCRGKTTTTVAPSTLHGVAGNTLALLRFEFDDSIASESAAVLSRHAFREDGLANWPGSLRPQLARPRDGRICLQWCTGSPGVVGGAWDYLDEDLVLAGAELV
jgi:hypothetical protein